MQTAKSGLGSHNMGSVDCRSLVLYFRGKGLYKVQDLSFIFNSTDKMAVHIPKLYADVGSRGEAECIRLLFKDIGQAYTEVPVDAATKKQLNDAGYLLFNELPMVAWTTIGKLGNTQVHFCSE